MHSVAPKNAHHTAMQAHEKAAEALVESSRAKGNERMRIRAEHLSAAAEHRTAQALALESGKKSPGDKYEAGQAHGYAAASHTAAANEQEQDDQRGRYTFPAFLIM